MRGLRSGNVKSPTYSHRGAEATHAEVLEWPSVDGETCGIARETTYHEPIQDRRVQTGGWRTVCRTSGRPSADWGTVIELSSLRLETVRGPQGLSLALRDGLAECWAATANSGGAVGFPWPPVSDVHVTEAVDALAARIEAGQTLLVVALDGPDEVVGWVSLDYNDSRLVDHWATVRRLQTHPGAQGHGVGTALMAELVRIARKDELRQLHLAVRGGIGLEDFYERLGWQVVGRWPDALRFAEDDYRDEVLMACQLGPANE